MKNRLLLVLGSFTSGVLCAFVLYWIGFSIGRISGDWFADITFGMLGGIIGWIVGVVLGAIFVSRMLHIHGSKSGLIIGMIIGCVVSFIAIGALTDLANIESLTLLSIVFVILTLGSSMFSFLFGSDDRQEFA